MIPLVVLVDLASDLLTDELVSEVLLCACSPRERNKERALFDQPPRSAQFLSLSLSLSLRLSAINQDSQTIMTSVSE